MGARAVYTTRERVMRAADVKAAAYATAEIDAAIESGAQAIDRLCHRGDATRPGFAPWMGSITFDWPSDATGNTGNYRLWLGSNSLISLTAATSDGADILSSAYGWPLESAPYRAVELDRAGSLALSPGDAGGQRSAVLTGLWSGCPLAERNRATWQLSGSPNASVTTLTLNAPVNVGHTIRLDNERLFVNERAWAASGQTGTLAASAAAQILAVSDSSAFYAGEELILDAERLMIRDIVGTNVIVQRAVGGSTLAAHTAAAIYWSRTFTVERGVLGTTAAAHTSGALVHIYQPPSLIEQLNIAYALDQRAQESAAYTRTIGTGDTERQATGGGIRALEERVYAAFGRKLRHRAV